jgi:hypothetical protein
MIPDRATVLEKLAGTDVVQVTNDNLSSLRREHAHPFVDDCRAGDLVWSIPFPTGDHIAAIWFRGDNRPSLAGGLGRNGQPTLRGAVVIDGDLLLLVTENGEQIDLRRGRLASGKR